MSELVPTRKQILSAVQWPLSSEGHYIESKDRYWVAETYMELGPVIAAILNEEWERLNHEALSQSKSGSAEQCLRGAESVLPDTRQEPCEGGTGAD